MMDLFVNSLEKCLIKRNQNQFVFIYTGYRSIFVVGYEIIVCFFNSISKGQNCVSGKSCGVFDCLIESEDSFLLSIRRDAALKSTDRRSFRSTKLSGQCYTNKVWLMSGC